MSKEDMVGLNPDRTYCPICGYDFEDHIEAVCPVCQFPSDGDERITDDDDYAWVE